MEPPEASNLANVAGLLELCDAQQAAIERLQSALEEYERTESDRHLLKRMLAHELRTPLTAIIGTLHTLSLEGLPEDRAGEMRERALRQAEQLNELIDDILHLSDPHPATVHRTPQEWVHVGELIDDVTLTVASKLPASRLTLRVPDDLVIRTIPGRVRQILVNLLVNAAKYSPARSTVELSVERRVAAVQFEVADRGPGVPAALADSLFRPFARACDDGTGGLGLGLYVVRNLAQSLGGTVELLPNPPAGTRARVTLPQKRLEDAPRRLGTGRHLRAVSSRRG